LKTAGKNPFHDWLKIFTHLHVPLSKGGGQSFAAFQKKGIKIIKSSYLGVFKKL
jgi:hypothetical protein